MDYSSRIGDKNVTVAMPPAVLLAKSGKNSQGVQPRETLRGHTEDVIRSFGELFGVEEQLTRLGRRWLRFFQLNPDTDAREFIRHGLAACVWHDVGKANSGFQEAVRQQGLQVIRHEHLSGLLLWLPLIRKYLGQSAGFNCELVVCAVIGHHLKAGKEEFAVKMELDRQSFVVYAYAVREFLELFAKVLDCGLPPTVEIEARWSFRKGSGGIDIDELRTQMIRELRVFWRRSWENDSQRRLLMAVRAGLILADSAGSGVPREGEDLRKWVRAAFDESLLLDGSAIEEKVIRPRIEQLVLQKGTFAWSDFQQAADHFPSRVLLIAPCGSGKTLAAWRWIKARLDAQPCARVIFLYPTRATATEGFHDYVSWAPEADAALIHGTSTYELADMFTNPTDERNRKDFTTNNRLFALGYWPRRIFSATVDQFLGFMQHGYGSICLMPLLADSVVVIDEVHSFDKSLFSALKVFLKFFEVPVLCMTASLPEQRRRELEACGLPLFPTDPARFADLQAVADMPRYHLQCIEGKESASQIARKGLEEGKRILWVVNTIAQCQSLGMALNSLCYHSRFRLEDRKERHHEVIEAFQQSREAVLAVTTQVCEMSLDLDADILISETAPITALIQRMGRCNRHARPGKENKLGQVFFYPAASETPYKKEELTGVSEFLKQLDGRQVSQACLQELLERHGPQAVEMERYAAFVESGPWASGREETLREDQDFTAPAVLDSDVERYLALQSSRCPTDGLLVPVPRRFARKDDRLKPWLGVAKAEHYHERWGFLDKPLEGMRHE